MSDCEVKLVAVTKPVIEGLNTAEDFVAYAARVSNPANQHNTETSGRLLKYLLKHKHWSPFEMAHAVMEINTTRDIARQILRHRSFAFQEFSQRYANATDLGFVTREARLQDTKNRQASIDTNDSYLKYQWQEVQDNLLEVVKASYEWALESGIAKEQARAVLPEGLTKSRLYMSGTLRSWIHFCQVRCDMSTQKEHREVAEKVLEILRKEFPSISELVNDIQQVGV
jgi:thymidylate synthase (FAD)